MTDAPEMNVGDAISIVRRVANVYQAMKRLEDVLVMVEKAGTEVAARERVMADLAADADGLRSDIKGLETEKAMLAKELAAKRAAADEAMNKERAEVDAAKAAATAKAKELATREKDVAAREKAADEMQASLIKSLADADAARVAAASAEAEFRAKAAQIKSIMGG